jgi:hypothetical protein
VVFLLLIVAALFGIYLWGLIDSIIRPDWAYTRAGSNKVMWILLIVLLGFIPAAVYLAATRPKLIQAESQARPSWELPVQSPWASETPPPGWFPDPTNRHELRYWNGRTWTSSVSNQGDVAVDHLGLY